MNFELIANSYNKDKLRSFCSKASSKKYLNPIGLYDVVPRREMGNDSTLLTEKQEKQYFEALHYIKYRI